MKSRNFWIKLLITLLTFSHTIPVFLPIGIICWAGTHKIQNGLRNRNFTKSRKIILTFQKIAGPGALIRITPNHFSEFNTGWPSMCQPFRNISNIRRFSRVMKMPNCGII
ncbi:hypothetical protein EH221_07335 [bacterium]|nr:MAG: hypothetical protein EH221_07335 [bacterium]